MKVRHKITVAGIVAALIPVVVAISVIVWQVTLSDNRKAFQIVQGVCRRDNKRACNLF